MRCSKSGQAGRATDTEGPCDRCKRYDRPCRMPPPRPSGRKPGSLGRYRGVEKALRKIQAELRKAKASSSDSPNLHELLDLTDGKEEILDLFAKLNPSQTHHGPTTHLSEDTAAAPSMYVRNSGVPDGSPSSNQSISPSPTEHNSGSSPLEGHRVVSNPLGLVADACGESQAPEQQPDASLSTQATNADLINLLSTSGHAEPGELARNLLRHSGYVSTSRNLDQHMLEHGLCTLLNNEVRTYRYKDYFQSSDTNEDRDTGPDVDPVDLGLVSMAEAHYLFPL